MDYIELYYTPQDIAKYMFEIDLGAKKQEPFISAVWLKEQAFIAPEWRKQEYKTFYKTVMRFLDGCVDVADKKKDIKFWNNTGKENPNINYTEKDYINDFKKLKFTFFKELRLKFLFFEEGTLNYVYYLQFLLQKSNSNIDCLEYCLNFYRLQCRLFNGKTIDLKKCFGSESIYLSILDKEGIYSDYLRFPMAEYNEEENEDIAYTDNQNIDVEFEYDMLITTWDLIEYFKKENVKQKGRSNQLQLIELLCSHYWEFLYTSNNYSLAYLIYEETKRCAEYSYTPSYTQKYNLIKYIKIKVIRTDTPLLVNLDLLLDDLRLPHNQESMKKLQIYLKYYELGCLINGQECNVETLTPQAIVQIVNLTKEGS